jgi:hypothetical protein
MVLHSNPAVGFSHDGGVDLGFVPNIDPMRSLADLTMGYGNLAPVSGFPALNRAPLDVGPSSVTPARPAFGGLLPPLLNTPHMRPADPAGPLIRLKRIYNF